MGQGNGSGSWGIGGNLLGNYILDYAGRTFAHKLGEKQTWVKMSPPRAHTSLVLLRVLS